MRYKGAKIVVLCCFLVHIFFSVDFFLIQVLPQKGTAFGSVAQGVAYLFYPLVGLLADVCFTRYKVILASALLRLIVATFGTGLLLAWTLGILVDFHFVDRVYTHNFVYLGNGYTVAMIASTGVFEANAIQFGMDQMLEASSSQLSTFIHWYYFSRSVAIGLLTLILASIAAGIVFHSDCFIHISNIEQAHTAVLSHSVALLPVLTTASLQLVMPAISVLLLICCKKHLTIEPAGYNPFTTVYKVLKYAWQHKCPENRSAFTYWKEDIPPRVDLGKKVLLP